MTILDDLVAGAIEDAQAREQAVSVGELERAIGEASPAIDTVAALAASDTIKVIAEIKRASPSKGHIADIPDPAALATTYATHGASAISVLTEGRQFLGSLDDLRAVRSAVDVPIIRKDFLVSEYQLLEARAAGADFVLLIVAALDDVRLRQLREFAASLGMAALVEAHNRAEVDRAVQAGAQLVGVNARNLHDFSLDTDLFGQMVDGIPDGVIRVAESAVKSVTDVEKYRASGADVVLVGEALVTGDPARLLTEFRLVRR